ncbi:HU family DNA-binding protein, partial [Myxococcota bacterium]|nr:HU family DNA-binding protein [Myxococcota bacterium]
MTKADIVEGVYERLGGFSKKEASAIVETILDVMKESLVAGDKV